MSVRLRVIALVSVGLLSSAVVPAVAADATTGISVASTVNSSLTAAMPIVRLHFSSPVLATRVPHLVTRPMIATTWQQIGPRDVQALATSPLGPFVNYTVSAPTKMSCATRCSFTHVRSFAVTVATSVIWEEELLATLRYLPVTFSPAMPQFMTGQPTSGIFSWSYPKLANLLSGQWRQGENNVIVTGAIMAFQSDHHLATTGVADPTTWNALVVAARQNALNPSTYNFVEVSATPPQTLTMFVAGRPTFHTLVNTGISVSPTALGTFPVYLRYSTQTMSGTNPDGSHYSDPGIPWVSYFNRGDALHGFIRSTYGWPQSLGCVEMPFSSAQMVWPTTGIGTLVTVH